MDAIKEQYDYNSDPVYYCKDCISLRVKTVSAELDLDFCDKCGSTNITTASIEEWRDLYKERYGFEYLTDKITKNGREKTYL